MLSRRDVLQAALAAAAVAGLGQRSRAQTPSMPRQEDLLSFRAKGQVTLLHMADCHAQLKPVYFREPSINLGVGAMRDVPPHLTGDEMLRYFNIDPGTWDAYALASSDFEALARQFGRVGGMDRIATLVKAIRGDRGADRTLFIDGGDALQGSYTALQSRGGDMIRVLEALGVDATTGHWEFTLGADRVRGLYGGVTQRGSAKPDFLAGNVVDNDFQEPVFRAWNMYEKGGLRIAVIGQAFPYTSVANPRWMFPAWSFGIREETVRAHVGAARAAGADLVVLNSHNGFDVDRKLASRVDGIDVIFTAHTHDALPVAIRAGRTLLIASGSHGKFLSRLDLEVKDRQVAGYAYALIPVLSDAIAPDPEMAALIQEIRAPHEVMLGTELGRTDTLLYRRGNFAGSFDELICDALLEEREAEICLSPGFRWGATVLPGQSITWDDLYNMTATTYPAAYRIGLNGHEIKHILEDVADNLFNPDPYYQQGGDMVRAGGLGFTIDVDAPAGRRISDMTLLRTGERIVGASGYAVTGWASVNEGAVGPPVWELVARYIQRKQTIAAIRSSPVKVVRGG